jgi:3-oxoacyl-[acyl-carrier-protein] synthase-3
MSATIKSTAVSVNGATSSLDLVFEAGTKCIENSGIDCSDIDVLISIGVYHDDNIVEPAMASLIQQKLGINPDPVKDGTMKFTFCFDIYNGACGFLNAMQVADSLIKSGQAKTALVVSADSHPSKTRQADFPFTPLGAAVLLTDGDHPEKGFNHYYINTAVNGYEGFVGGADLSNRNAEDINGKKFIELKQDHRFHEAPQESTVQSARDYFDQPSIDLAKVGHLIVTEPEKGFAARIYQAIGLNGITNIVDLYSRHGNTHTSSLPLGIHALMESGALKENDNVLLVATGSGLTSAFAMYTA